MRFVLLFTFACLCICPSLSFLNRDELEAAVSAFDEFAAPKPVKTSNRVMVHTVDHEVESPIVQQADIEEVFVKEKAHCTGCPYDLDTSGSDVVKIAKDALSTINDGYTYNYLRLLKATAEVENGYVYNLKVEANRCMENGSCSEISCVLELKNTFGIQTQPELTYYSCMEV